MAYENAPTNVNILRSNTTQIPQAGNGKFAQQEAAKYTQVAEAPVQRTVPPLTRYNKETGRVDNLPDMGAIQQDEESPKTVPQKEQTVEEQDRFSKWKEEQAVKKAEREAAKLERAQKEQELGASLLKKGDIVGAAKAFGMSPADLIALVSNGAMGIKPEEPEPKKLSVEEQLRADLDQLRKEKEESEAERKAWQFNKESSEWIEKNITPEFSNKDKYELLHQFDPAKVQRTVYNYMNQHYQETNEVLSVVDILESMENEILADRERALEANKGIKKLSKYFSPVQSKEEVEYVVDPEDRRDIDPWAKQKTPDVKPYSRPAERKDLNISQEKPMVLNANEIKPGKKSSFNLTRAERIALARIEEEEDRKRSK